MKKLFLSFFFVGLINLCFAQSSEIVFYGFDFSHFHLADPKYLGSGNEVKSFVHGWIDFVNGYKTQVSLTRLFQKSVVVNQSYISSLVDKLDGRNIVSSTKVELSADSLQSIVLGLKDVSKSGTGLLEVVECFDKSKSKVSAWFVLFDISTGKILHADYQISGGADGYGMVKYWGHALDVSLAYYVGKIYKKKY